MTLIFFSSQAPRQIVLELSGHGHEVFEALFTSEVLALAKQYPFATIIIDSSIATERAKVIQTKFPTITLKSNATIKDILFELPQRGAKFQ
jgi:hypothetical protein